MTKILGLDLGTNSIGWAIIDKERKKIAKSGVRIFKEGVVKDSIGKGDLEKSNNAERREHRQARRLHYRKKLRKTKLLKVLIENEMCPLSIKELNKWKNWDKQQKTSGIKFPDTIEFVEWLKLNPYKLRAIALEKNITNEEFGRILYHFIQRRGFLSTRKGSDDGALYKGKDNMEGINDTKKRIGHETLGKTLNQYLPKENAPYSLVTDENGNDVRVRARYTLREMYVDEFEKIWEKQSRQLNLDDILLDVKKGIHLKGDINSKRNIRRIDSLQNRYGKSNVKVEGSKIMVNSKIKLKEYLAGDITVDSDGTKFNSNNSVLFWQRPLRSQKGLLAKCTFENSKYYDKDLKKWIEIGKTPCPVSHPEFELFRAHQFINNIRFGSKNVPLTDDLREQALQLINNEDKNFDFKKIPQKLKLTFENFNYANDLKVSGNTTHKRLMDLFPQKTWHENMHDIWHYFYSFTDKDMLANKLVEKFGFDKNKAEKASHIKLKEGYSNISLKAIRNILPFLERGYQYSTAVILGGVKNAFGERWAYFKESHSEIISRVVKIIEQKKYKEYELIVAIKKLLSDPENSYGFNVDDKAFKKLYHHSQDIVKKQKKERLSEIKNLRNPIVQKGLHEMRRLVNAILDEIDDDPEYGPNFSFDRIHVELSRNLRNSKKQRQDIVFRIRDNEAANEEARNTLQEFGLKPSRENITKYRLFKEIKEKHGNVICPYTKKGINIADLLGQKNLYQIEHIIPYSVSLDDSFANKTLCESNFNRNKGEKTPYEYYQQNSDPKIWGADSWDEIEQRTFSLLPYNKARRFISKKSFESEGFIERQLNDGRYIAKKSAEILKEICDDVRVMPGQLTSELRRLWGLNNVIQPVMPLNEHGIKVDAEINIPHYVVLDSNKEPKTAISIPNEQPETTENQLLVPGIVNDKNVFEADSKYRNLKFKIKTEGISKGRYWAKVNVSSPLKFTKVFVDKPDTEPGEVLYRGRVENGRFSHDSLKGKIDTSNTDGIYWAKLPVIKTSFFEPDTEKPLAKKSNQILLFGIVGEDNMFSSYIFRCESNLNPGKYWALLDIDFKSASFTKAVVQPTEIEDNQIIVYGDIAEDKKFCAEFDPNYLKQTELNPGKYYTVLEVEDIEGFYEIENKPPKLQKGETLIEGNVWVDKNSGEIKFDPKKNRDDHRHHAVDAITIALTELSYLQKLSHYYGELKDRERGIAERPEFEEPWPNFDKDVKKAVDNILVAYATDKKVFSKISKVIEKNGNKYKSIGFAVRGGLHRETYFGRHPGKINSQSKGGFEKDKNGNIVYYYHVRKSVNSIEDYKHVRKIVDDGIRKLIIITLQDKYGVDTTQKYNIPKNFFFDKEGKPQIFLPNRRGEPVPIKKIRLKEIIGNAVQLKEGVNQWVNPYNNHHVVIYLNSEGELKEDVVSFWQVIERIQQKQDIYQLPADGSKIITTLQVNDMFLLNLPQDISENIRALNVADNILCKYLFRVQKISSNYYTFRHHLASTILKTEEEVRIRSMSAWQKANPIKVKVDLLGKLKIL